MLLRRRRDLVLSYARRRLRHAVDGALAKAAAAVTKAAAMRRRRRGCIVLALVLWWTDLEPLGEPAAGFGTVSQLGTELFSTFFYPFEVISLLLIAAMVGAVILAKRRL